MSLLEKQTAFMRSILYESAPLPEGWDAARSLGMSVYRGNYRSALMGALESTFERTARYVGPEAFRQAAINHLIAHPPSHWTIDAAGESFDATCAQLFDENPEVAELAWLEWSMLQLASAPDVQPVTAEDFAAVSAGFGESEWMQLSLTFQPRMAAIEVKHDLEGLWRTLGEDNAAIEVQPFETAHGCIAWRECERPTFRIVPLSNAEGFAAMREGARYGDLIALVAGEAPSLCAIQQAARDAGAMLGQWLGEGMVTAIHA